jgi:DNA-binding beta-propeller fold protein YncE
VHCTGRSTTSLKHSSLQRAIHSITHGANNNQQYGDKDGVGYKAQLQYPTGLAAAGTGRVLCTDTYNHKIKLLLTAAAENRCKQFAGTGTAGYRDGPGEKAQFSAPTAIAAAPDVGTAWVADNRNGVIRVIDLETRAVSTLALTGVPAAAAATER